LNAIMSIFNNADRFFDRRALLFFKNTVFFFLKCIMDLIFFKVIILIL
jgi:hypothetical protein